MLILVLLSISVSVNVYNNTLGKAPVSNQEVYLFGFTTEGNLTVQDTGLTNKGGKASFEIEKGYIYIFQTNFKDVSYISDPLDLSKESFEEETDLPVFEVTTDEDSISLETGHIVINRRDNSLFATEMLAFNNFSSRTYTGGILFVLPEGSGPSFSPAEPVIQNFWNVSGDTIFYLGPVLPGSRILAFQFKLAGSGRIPVSMDLPFEANMFRLLFASEVKLLNSSLKYSDDMEIGDGSYRVYEGEKVKTFSFVIERPGMGGVYWIIVIAVALVILLSALFLIKRRSAPVEK